MAAGKLILVAKLKGGSGATTTCRELATAALQGGLKVALIDLDGQGGLCRAGGIGARRRRRMAMRKGSPPTSSNSPPHRSPQPRRGCASGTIS